MNELENMEHYKSLAAGLIQFGIEHTVNILSALAILVAGYIVAGWLARLARRRLEKVERFDKTLIPVVTQVIRYAILVFTLILVLAEFGIQTTSIIAVLGAAGLAIGLALQGTLQNVAAGFMLLFLRPFTAGDSIETAAGSGSVDEIGLFMTQLRTAQGVFVAVPNSKIWSDSIINYSRLPHRRVDLVFGISYEDDIDKARALILKLAEQEGRVLEDPATVVNVTSLGDSAVDLELRAWTRRQDYWQARWDLIREVKYGLDKAGISIPYPHVQMVSSQARGNGPSEGLVEKKQLRR